MPERKLERVADVLNRVVRSLDIERELLTHTAGPVWERAVGERLAPHTRATQLRGGILRVEARSASWMNEVSLLREQIRERINSELNGLVVHEVRFRLGGGFAPVQEVRAPATLTSDELERATKALSEAGEGAQLAARAYALSMRKR